MTTAHTCDICKTRRSSARYDGMCGPCFKFGEWENTHSDEKHSLNPDPECPVCRGDNPANTEPRRVANVSASTVDQDGNHLCQECRQVLPITKFPTRRVGAGYVRDTTRCRNCKSGVTTAPTTQVFACRDHAPFGIKAESYDDGRPSCSVCGKANYAVKPYVLKTEVVERGWRTVNYETVQVMEPST